MLPAAVLNAKPGERILDLCAAPGGKSTKIAANLQGEGLLWANEISAERTKALLHNIERIGCRNSLITRETPERMAALLPEYFDAVLVDAPCSGSGMFRRDPNARESWLQFDRLYYATLQRDILRSACGPCCGRADVWSTQRALFRWPKMKKWSLGCWKHIRTVGFSLFPNRPELTMDCRSQRR